MPNANIGNSVGVSTKFNQMKIGIEAQRVFRKKKHGMDMVVLELIRNLQQIDKQNEYVVFVKPDEDKCLSETKNFKIVELSGGPYPTWEQLALPKAAKAEGCDILHCTSNTGPVYSSVPLITILHDIIYLETVSVLQKGGTWYQKLGNMYRRWIVPPVVRRSKRVVTVSNFEKERIRNFLKLGDNLVAIYNGVGVHFKEIADKKVLDSAKSKYNLPDHFFFFLGNTDPKKNTENVLRAFAEFNKKAELKYKLLMLDYDEEALLALLERNGIADLRSHIQLLGYVQNTDLPAIINQCSIFLYPSLRESFGIPVLEGMACGVPVITSNTSSMPEVAGAGALLVDPEKPEEIASTMLKVIANEELRTELCNKGLQRAKKFSWKAMAEANLKLYREVYSEIKQNQS